MHYYMHDIVSNVWFAVYCHNINSKRNHDNSSSKKSFPMKKTCKNNYCAKELKLKFAILRIVSATYPCINN